jgi:hypothetical protein
MIKKLLFLMLGWTAQLLGAVEPQGLSYETAVPLRDLFFHEIPAAIDKWVKLHVSDAEISEQGQIVSFGQRKTHNERQYYVEHVSLRTKALVPLYFEIVEPLSSEAHTIKELFVSPEYLKTVQQFDSAEVCMLDLAENSAPQKTTFQKIPDNIAAQFRSALLAKSSYNWDGGSICGPVYVARLRLHHGEKILDIDFCFQCGQMQIYTDKRSLPRRDFTSPAFRELFSAIFPDEAKFQKK